MKASKVKKPNKLKGIAVSPGIIIGKARLIDRSRVKILYQYLIDEAQVNKEVKRFRDALEDTKEQIVTLKNRMPDQIKKHAFILDTHLMIMDDSMLSDSTVNTILEEQINAEWALKKSVQHIKQLFDQIDDEYIRERFNDVETVAERILRNLAGEEQESLLGITERAIIVAHDLTPGDTSEIDTGKVTGFITEVGGRTYHTAIMAQALKIPAVVGLESATSLVQDGMLIIVDGHGGEVILDPDDATIVHYQEKQIQFEKYESSILRKSHLPAETIDGHRLSIEANIEFLEEVEAAKEYGAEGIGLYRTEYLYLKSKDIPSVEELYGDYREVAEIMAPNPVTIRTLDLGGDKFSTSLGLTKEVNPALGLRSIRLCLKEPKIFKDQLRAILMASAHGNIRLMFPMISGLEELVDAKKILKRVMEELDREGVEFDRDVKVGAMIEIPSAVAVADILAKHVDFFSIGTNDLIQYTLAVDRINEHVAYMYQPLHPSILRMIQQVAEGAKQGGIKVALCGEMAADPMYASILLGLGIDGLSMSAGVIPVVKKVFRSLSMKEAKSDMKKIIKLETEKKIRKFVKKKMKPYLQEVNSDSYGTRSP